MRKETRPDFESERTTEKIIHAYSNITKITQSKPYNDLLYTLEDAAKALQHEDRKALQRLAWFLGMNGEVQACQQIMKHAKEAEPYRGYGMYGHVPWF